MVSTQANM